MKIFQLALFCFICIAKSYGQTATRSYWTVNVEITKEKKPKKLYTKVSIDSAFRSRDSTWVEELENDLNRTISVKNKFKAGKYIVSVKLLIEKDGSLNDIRCLSDPSFGLCEQVMDVMKRRVRGNWDPSSGSKVREYHRTPITPSNDSASKNQRPM